MQENPYSFETSSLHAPPEPNPSGEHSSSDLFAIREKHISHEDSIFGISIVMFLGGAVILLFAAFTTPFAATAGSTSAPSVRSTALVLASSLFLGITQLIIGIGISRLNKYFRIPGAIVCVPWIFSIVGTLPSIYFIYLLLSPKGKYVFTDEYKAVVKKTPGVVTKTSLFSWSLLAIFIGFLVLLFALV